MKPESDHSTFTTVKEIKLEVATVTKKPTNWYGNAKRDVTHPTATVSIIFAIVVSKTYMHDWASTRMGELTATT